MVRRGEEWTYGEPELNDRGLPVIHNIAEKLGCIRPAPDVSYTFPEGEEDFLELQQRLQASASLEGSDNKVDPHDSEHTLDRNDRSSSSESDHSTESNTCNSQNHQVPHMKQEAEPISSPQIKQEIPKVFSQSRIPQMQIQIPRRGPSDFGKIPTIQQPSPRSAFTSESYSADSPFTSFALGSDDFLGPAPALDITASYLRQQQKQQRFSFSQPLPYNLNIPPNPSEFSGCNEMMNVNYYNSGMGDGTIRPGMLEGGMDYDFDRMDSGDMIFDYGENNMMMAS